MTTQSDRDIMVRISATDASRSFSKMLDEVESGQRFLVQRHGRDVCLVSPPPVGGRRASECLALLGTRTPAWLDDRFGSDLEEALSREPIEERSAWVS